MDLKIKQEIANSITHGIGFGLSIAALVILVVFSAKYGTAVHVISNTIYGASLVLAYASSTFYHAIQKKRPKHFFKIMDHISIYFLIAGTYTPFTLISLKGGWGWSIFFTVWGLAIIGVVLKIFFVDKFEIISTIVYILMGWIIIIAIKPLISSLPPQGVFWLALGGISYTFGVIFFFWERLPYNHAIWHLFVMFGSVCHFIAVIFYVILK